MGNPYDGHTLQEAFEQIGRIAQKPEHAFVDMGYRSHDYEGECDVHVDKLRRGSAVRSLWRWMKRRAAIQPEIGNLKRDHRMDRFRLKGIKGDQINAILSAAGMNFGKLLKAAFRLPAYVRLFFECLRRALCLQRPPSDRLDHVMLFA